MFRLRLKCPSLPFGVGPRILGGLTDASWFSVIIFAVLRFMLAKTATRRMES